MNLDELKISWKSLDEKADATKALSEQLVLSIMRDRSTGTISVIQRKLRLAAVYFGGLLILFTAVLAGNPFDYTHWYEYMPAIAYTLLVVAGLAIIIRETLAVGNITLSKNNLRDGIQKVIHLHETYKSIMHVVWKISMAIGFLLGISLMVRNFEGYGLTKSVLVILANAGTVAVMYLLATLIFKKLPDTNLEALKMDLAELEEMNA